MEGKLDQTGAQEVSDESRSGTLDVSARPDSSRVPGRGSAVADIQQVVQGLETELRQRRRRRWLRLAAVVLTLSALLGGLSVYRRTTAPPPEAQFTTAAIEVRDVVEKVQSTGVVEPVNKVEVGAQVSGRVVDVEADFNDRVERGQLLAVIDPELFGAEVTQAQAQLTSALAVRKRAEATRDAARVRLERMKTLVAEQAASEAELDQIQADFDIAEAEVGAAAAEIAQVRARLRSASTTLEYTKIYSPIDGVVIDRQIEPGQTVASSFNTPVLFVIAQDLEQMRVLAEIDEADVGKVREGMDAEIVVDAFPDDRFAGKLVQLRLSPNNVEGVVTYAAVILVSNQDGKLRPGMTATSTLVSQNAEKVLAVRNAALRFEPLPPAAVEGQKPKLEEKLPPAGPGRGRVYQTAKGPIEAPGTTNRVVEIGVSDGVWTELRSGLVVGDEVIVDEKPREERRGFRLF